MFEFGPVDADTLLRVIQRAAEQSPHRTVRLMIVEDTLAVQAADEPEPDGSGELCSQCGGSLADGEGWDGLCGSCADRADNGS